FREERIPGGPPVRSAEMKGLGERLSNRWLAHRWQRFLDHLQIAHQAPYPLHIYRRLLSQALSHPQVRLLPFTQSASAPDGPANLYVRHDVDTADCMRNLALLLDVDRELGVPAGVFLRADGREYALEKHRERIGSYRAAGLEIGLHTVCYLEEDYLGALQRETERFSRALGFRPSSFTVHGLGPHRMDARLRFCQEISARLREFGYSFSDCSPHLRAYDYTIHDSHWSQEARSRFIYSDFLHLSPLRGGRNYILLTHPGYWVESRGPSDD
ncbi:MAG: hypothetical protein QHH30_03570, partial [candidate division NC10 bacterium]|nr:hypothetical protein [candidate division NC10 bacterium]